MGYSPWGRRESDMAKRLSIGGPEEEDMMVWFMF